MMSTVDQIVIAKFKHTLQRFGIYKTSSFQDAIADAHKKAIENFGKSAERQIYVSPKTYEAFKGLTEQLKDE
jgi:DNA polymerase/3'-5' exonuclease PolX